MPGNTSGTLRDIGQEKESYDCGYFAAFALQLPSVNEEFTQDDVYLFRNAFLRKVRGDSVVLPEGPLTGGYRQFALEEAQAADFLTMLGCPGYRTYYRSAVNMTELALTELLAKVVHGQGERSGILINSGMAHWLAVVCKVTAGGAPLYCIYNPSERPARGLGTAADVARALMKPNVMSFVCRQPPVNFLK
jgi:hypothetical protein